LRLRPTSRPQISGCCCLDRISELEEIPFSVIEADIVISMETVQTIPSVEEDVNNVEIVEAIDNTEDSLELIALKERANKLSEQLKLLNASEDNSEVSSMVEINDEENTIIETDDDTKKGKFKEKTEDSDLSPVVNNIANENGSPVVPRKQRNFVQLMNKTVLGDSLEEVNKILVGIEQDLAINNLNNEEKQESASDDKSSSDDYSDKDEKQRRPKKTISFCLPEIPPTQAESSDQDSPSDDKALIDDHSFSSEATVSENLANVNDIQPLITDQRKKIELKALKIEQSFGNICKQKYFSDQDKKQDVKTEVGAETVKDKSSNTGWKSVQQKEVYAYPDYTPSVYRTNNSRGRNFWQMPFRHKLYQEVLHPSAPETSDSEDEAEDPPPPPCQEDLDPRMFAPTGDVYSYFQRRRVDPFFYTNPLVHSTRNSLGGRYAKTIVF